MVLTWYLIARAFDRGSSHRRALPLELILAIFHYTDFFVPITDLGSHSKKPIKVTASSYAVVRKAWFESPVLDTATLARVVGCQLRTSSRDQGWADRPEAGSWTWFELSLERPREAEQPLHHARMFRTLDEAVGEDQWREVRWRSHCNRTANQLRHNLSGLRFERGHEIWRLARAGDRIAVTVCAQYGAWSNDAESGVLELWARFVPSCI
ncbi:hypothetical protein BKA62DRAFT_717335 [Auriculariales sp. MPI-PUGE-AT-0066]|nr:hypothetical protein BKA62DRAFT_717335 [Auriculariales sp. MPI-PUGE-AT-0066]